MIDLWELFIRENKGDESAQFDMWCSICDKEIYAIEDLGENEIESELIDQHYKTKHQAEFEQFKQELKEA